jgi:hypothetical protein
MAAKASAQLFALEDQSISWLSAKQRDMDHIAGKAPSCRINPATCAIAFGDSLFDTARGELACIAGYFIPAKSLFVFAGGSGDGDARAVRRLRDAVRREPLASVPEFQQPELHGWDEEATWVICAALGRDLMGAGIAVVPADGVMIFCVVEELRRVPNRDRQLNITYAKKRAAEHAELVHSQMGEAFSLAKVRGLELSGAAVPDPSDPEAAQAPQFVLEGIRTALVSAEGLEQQLRECAKLARVENSEVAAWFEQQANQLSVLLDAAAGAAEPGVEHASAELAALYIRVSELAAGAAPGTQSA